MSSSATGATCLEAAIYAMAGESSGFGASARAKSRHTCKGHRFVASCCEDLDTFIVLVQGGQKTVAGRLEERKNKESMVFRSSQGLPETTSVVKLMDLIPTS